MKTKARGAPRGNRNAWKHGFYSASFTARERRLVDSASTVDLGAEIELIRVANSRLLQALQSQPDSLDFPTQLAALRAVNLSARCITGLIRAHAVLYPDLDRDQLAGLLRLLRTMDLNKDLEPREARAVRALAEKVLGPETKDAQG